jgi:hypothetical protein
MIDSQHGKNRFVGCHMGGGPDVVAVRKGVTHRVTGDTRGQKPCCSALKERAKTKKK